MNKAFLSIAIVLIGCSSPNLEMDQKMEATIDPNITTTFEGREFVKLNDSTYQSDAEDYQTFITLDSNGQVRSVEHQGQFLGCGALVDTSRYFNETGALIKQIYHNHWMPDEAEGCHASIQDLDVTEFYPNGSIKAKKLFRMGYQDLEHEAGVWQEFDENGKVVSTINYGDPYSANEFLNIDFIEKLEANFGDSYNRSILLNKGFNQVVENNKEEGDFEFYNAKDDNRIIISRYVHMDGESIFTVKYYVNRNRLIAFEEALKEMKGTYAYHGSSADAYFKEGLGTYRTKKIKINLEKGEIVYTHVEGKEIQLPPINFEPIKIREL